MTFVRRNAIVRILVFSVGAGLGACDNPTTEPSPPTESATGTVGQPCSDGCPAHAGRPMACNDGRCELTDCEVGSLGCGCAADDSCNAFYPVSVTCSERGLCEPTDCTPGTHWCECGDGCSSGDQCIADVCRPSETQVSVAAAARACSFRITAGGADVVFGQGITGKVHRRGDAMGVAIASVEGSAIEGPALRVQPRDPATSVSVSSAQCVDAQGRRLSDPGVRIQ